MLLWVARRIPNCKVRDFLGAFQDGKALLCLIEACKPGLVNLAEAETWTPMKRIKLALELAELGLSIPPIIAAEDVRTV